MNLPMRKLDIGAAILVANIVVALAILSVNGAPAWAADRAMPETGIGLSDVSNAENTLVTAKLKASDGGILGQVHALTRGTDGKIRTVEIALNNGPVVALDAGGLVYLSNRNLILTPLTANQVRSLPPLQG